ncbi:hypothetical protein AAFF_G00066510 [Aldrovandia affinis]|uniref:TMEM248/TMEM219 domain-containing protein n=1 Tax=Aldrovandia affinis TaxID=143900 RepID=A0AAD7T491_9TELE|nr:hypothetical protein AAFF_G00066510 [Aldrovandia affinis]
MGMWQPLGNLRSYLEHHPPTIIFFLCLLSLAATFIGFGEYSKAHDVMNPDIALDWNQVLASIANLKFCRFGNETEGGNAPSPDVDHRENASTPLVGHVAADGIPANASHPPLAPIHLSLLVPLALADSSQARSPASLRTTLWGRDIGLKGSAGNESLNLTLLFYSQPELRNSETGSTFTCLRVTAPAHILPQTPQPPVCPVMEDNNSDHSPLNAITSPRKNCNPQNALCYCMEFTSNANLTVMLSQEERDLAGHHLMMVSACLLSLCGLLCLFGSLSCSKSRRYHGNELDSQKEPLIDS